MLKAGAGEVVWINVEPRTYTINEVARALGVNRNSAYQAARAGELPVIKIGRRLLVPKVAFERMLAEAGQKTGDPKID
jgi:excisionase family DNA binding protein